LAIRPDERENLKSRRNGIGTRWLARFAVLGLAAVVSFAFPKPGLWWLGWVGLAPVFGLIAVSPDRGEALKRSWFAGVGYLTALHYWVIPHTGIFTIILAAFVGIFWLPIGLACWWGLRRHTRSWRRRAALVVVPSVWTLMEVVRSWEYLGGTWGLLGLSQWQTTGVLQAASLGGVWLLSFVLVAVNVALVTGLMPGPSRGERAGPLVVAVVLPLALVAYGVGRPDVTAPESVAIAGVQPGVFDSGEQRLEAHIEETLRLDGSTLDLVVWGQTSVAFDPSQDPELDVRLRSVAAELDADLFVNVDARSDEGIVKTTVQYTADGPVATYGKQRLVPFGEYIPLRPVFGWVADYTEAARQDRIRGEELTLMRSAGVTIGPLISYESTFPDMRRRLALAGVDLTIVQGGTQTFQGTWAQPQQASYEAVSAVATGRPAVLVAVSGVSAAFDARGELLAWYPADWTGGFVVDVPLTREDTLYLRFGDWVVWMSVLVVVGAVVASRLGAAPRSVSEPTRVRIVARPRSRPWLVDLETFTHRSPRYCRWVNQPPYLAARSWEV
jgi:apolipoprotein N-acyltransferase